MTREFPLLGIELLRLSRKRSVFGIRMAVVGLMFAVLTLLQFVVGQFGFTASDTDMISVAIQSIVAAVIFGATFFLPLLRATDAFAIEKRDGTLPILLLASTTTTDIVLAKAVIIMLECCVLLLSVMPLYAFGMFFGGITIGSIAIDMGSAAVSAAMITVVGLYFSAASRSVLAARVYTIGLFIALGIAFFLLPRVYGLAISGPLIMNPNTVTMFTVASIVLGVLFMALAFFGTVRTLKKLTIMSSSSRPVAKRSKAHKKSKSRDPVSAIIAGGVLGLGMRDYRLGLRILAVLVFGAVALVPGIGALIIVLILYWDIVTSLDSLRTSGAVDDIRIVPVSDGQLTRSIYRALFNGGGAYLIAMVLGPLSFVFFMQWVAEDFMEYAVVLTIASATAKYVAIIALAGYWGMAHGQRRFGGVFIYFFASFGGFIVGSVLDLFAYTLWDVSPFTPIIAQGVSLSVLVPLVALVGFTLIYAPRLGARWRADLSPGRSKLPPEVMAHVAG